MNNYTLKVDKVGTDEVFPYPIKLTYDTNNIYLTPMWIPSLLLNIVNSDNESLILTLEVATTRANYNIRNTGKIPWNSGHPCTTGKFYFPGAAYNNSHNYFSTWLIGNTYTISMQDFNKYFIPSNLRRLKTKIGTIYMKVRGTYRISNYLGFQRTQYHSNTAELTV